MNIAFLSTINANIIEEAIIISCVLCTCTQQLTSNSLLVVKTEARCELIQRGIS